MDDDSAYGGWSTLDDLAGHSRSWNDLVSAVEALVRRLDETGATDVDTDRPEHLTALLSALHYMARYSDGRTVFVPHLELADGSTEPAQLSDQPEEVIAQWRTGFERLGHPAWRSRLGHLVLLSEKVVEGRERPVLAELVCDEYLNIPTSWDSGLDRVSALRAAAGIARAFRINGRRSAVLRALAELSKQNMDSAEPLPGVALGCTAFLSEQSDADRAVVDALLERASTIWAEDIHRLDDVIAQQLKTHRSDTEQRRTLLGRRVEAWLQAATGETGVRRAVFLQRAVEYASASQDAALRARATAQLQSITLADLGMQTVSSAWLLREDEVAAAVRAVTDAADWRQALDVFAVMGPATGQAAENRAKAQHQMQTSISALFAQTMYGGDGLPRWTAATEEERLQYTIAQNALFELQFRGNLVAEALLRIPQHHDLPSELELTEHFSRSLITTPKLAAGLARSFLRWWSGDYEGAVFTATPRVENLARNLLLAIDQAIYRVQRQRTPGQYMGLGALLPVLHAQGLLDEDWHEYMTLVLVSPVGMNLRNELSHGFINDAGLMPAALVLQCAAHLARPSVSRDAEETS